MKNMLDQLTLQELIDLTCGEFNVLVKKGEKVKKSQILEAAEQVMREYKSIASPVQARMDLLHSESLSKLQMKDRCARICIMLTRQGHPEMAREVLAVLNVSPEHMETEEAVLAQCQAILGEVEFESKRISERAGKNTSKLTVDGMRKSWYSEIAFVMSVFKMSIDPGTINAAIYANLVHQASERSKMMAKMPTSGLI